VHGLEEDGVEPDRVTLQAVARISYEGQRYQLDVPLPTAAAWRADERFTGTLAEVPERFERAHRTSYGYTRIEPLSLFGLVVVGLARVGRGATLTAAFAGDAGVAESRDVWFAGGFRPTPILQRAAFATGDRFGGPAIVEQPDSTTVVPPGWTGSADGFGNIVLTRT